jgi:hypothetical protein
MKRNCEKKRLNSQFQYLGLVLGEISHYRTVVKKKGKIQRETGALNSTIAIITMLNV